MPNPASHFQNLSKIESFKLTLELISSVFHHFSCITISAPWLELQSTSRKNIWFLNRKKNREMNRITRRFLAQFSGQRDRFGGVSIHSTDYTYDFLYKNFFEFFENYFSGLTNFPRVLKNSLAEWHQTGVRGLWFHVSGDETSWVEGWNFFEYFDWSSGFFNLEKIPDLLREGFYCHHAKGDQVVLVKSGFPISTVTPLIFFEILKKWLPEFESNGIPEYPSTYIGCGTITLDQETNSILAIKEKVRFYNNWKFPGGYVDRGENILGKGYFERC